MIELFVFSSQPFLLLRFFHAFKDYFFLGIFWSDVIFPSTWHLFPVKCWETESTDTSGPQKNFLSPPMKNFKFKLFKFVFCIFFWCLLTIEKSLFLSTEWYRQIAHIDKHVKWILKKCSCSFKRAVIVKWSPHQTGTQEVGSPKP